MKSKYNYTFLLLSILLPLFMGCMSGNFSNGDNPLIKKMDSLESVIHSHPRLVAHKVDSMLPFMTDSLAYYHLLAIKAKSMFIMSELDSVKTILSEVLPRVRSLSDNDYRDELLSMLYNISGNYYSRLSLMDSARYCFQQAFDSATQAGAQYELPDLAINLADSYVRLGRFDLGSFWYWKSLALSDSLQIPEEKRFPSYFGLAQVHMELQDFAACDSFYEKAGKNFERMLPYEKHIYLNNRGNSYYFREDYQTALRYFLRSLKLVNSQPHMQFERHLTEVNLGEICLLLNKTDSAAYYLNNCHDFFKKTNNVTALYYIDTQLIELAIRQKNIPLARKRIAEAVKPDYVEPTMLHIRNRYIQHYYEQNGNFEKAYFYQKQNKRMDDSIRNAKVKMRSSEIALKYQLDNELMQKEILIRQQENEVLLLNQWIYILVFSALFVGALIWAVSLYRRQKNEKKLWSMQTAINSLRLENVRNRISPHFIFNVLNHEVSRFRDETDKTNLLTLVRLVRKHLQLTDQVGISLSDELDFVRSFLSLEKSSLGDNFRFQFHTDGSVDLDSFFIPSMSIYNLVENAVKHSLLMKEGARRLWITIETIGERVEIKLSDNGGGFKKDSRNLGTGTGFKVITQTIQLYNQYNKNPIYMKIRNVRVEDGEMGCEVSYSIPKDYTFVIKS